MMPPEQSPASEDAISKTNYVLIALLVILPAVFGFLGKPAEMGVIIVACSLALCFANLHKIESFKGAGFEARMRKAVEEAYATLESLQHLARPVLRSTIANITFNSRWDGMGPQREHQLMTELSSILGQLKMEGDPDIEAMLKEFYNHHAADHIRFIKTVMQHAHIANEDVGARLDALVVRTDDYVPPPGSAVRQAVAELTAEQRALLEPYVQDYEHYDKHRVFRRPEAASQWDLPSFDAPAA